MDSRTLEAWYLLQLVGKGHGLLLEREVVSSGDVFIVAQLKVTIGISPARIQICHLIRTASSTTLSYCGFNPNLAEDRRRSSDILD